MSASHLPDVLGSITGGQRANLQWLHVATALRPREVRAGRAFEMLLLIQNLSDLELEVTATLRLPEKDSKGQKDRFLTKAGRLIVKLESAGVGLIMLPVSSLPDTAPSSDYKIGMELKITPLSKDKPQRVRTDDEKTFNPETLDSARQAQIADLKNLEWTAQHSRSSIESALTITPGTVGSFANLQPTWTSLWTLRDHDDKSLLLQKLAPLIVEQAFPQMTANLAFPILLEYTRKRFAKAEYKLQEMEMNLIARLLTLMIVYAAADERKSPLMATGRDYNVARFFNSDVILEAADVIQLPAWFEAFMALVEKDARLIAHPVKATAHFLYDELMRDAMMHAFSRIEGQTEVEIGTAEERLDYIDSVLTATRSGRLDFELLYMPLVLGGIIVADQVLLKGEKGSDIFPKMRGMYDVRYSERNESNAGTFDLTNSLIEQSANKSTLGLR
jgi:hypothetical protein